MRQIKLDQDMYHSTPLIYQKMRVTMNGWVGGATKKLLENAMKLRESRL